MKNIFAITHYFERKTALTYMDYLVRMLNDESFYWGIWTHVVPDEATDEDFDFIAHDEELWQLVCEKFCKIMGEAR